MNLSNDKFTPDQQECIRHLGPLLISAGAGSGKTHTLTNRIVHALDSDERPDITSIDQILAITYTDKAASEIKSRVRSTLREGERSDQARFVDGAWISTIHGMSQRILRTYALDLGLDPGFGVLSGTQSQLLLEDAFNEVLKDTDVFAPLYQRLSEEYRGKDSVKNSPKAMVMKIIDEAGNLPGGLAAIQLGPEPMKPSAFARKIITAYEAYIAVVPKKTVAEKKKLDDLNRSITALEGFIQTGSTEWDEFYPILAGLPRPTVVAGVKEEARAVQALIDKAFLEMNLTRSLIYSKNLLKLANAIQDVYARYKREHNCIDIGESVALALKALREHPSIAQRYREQFKLIMVDEFQDTNQLQIDFIELLADEHKSNLCTVGDSQQSIYRFQGADINVYTKHKEDMRSEQVKAHCAQLDENFRSHADVLSFVRAICGQKGYFSEEFLDLKVGRKKESEYKGSEPRVDVSMTVYEQKITGAEMAAEAQAIARRFDELRKAGHSAKDMVLLLGRMSSPYTNYADIYAKALREAGFSTIITGGSGFFKAPEVKLVAKVLHMLANPANTEALYPVLAGGIFSLSDDDLIEITTTVGSEKGRGKPSNYGRRLSGSTIEGASTNTQFAQKVLQKAWGNVGTKHPSNILLDILVDSGWLLRLEGEGITGRVVAGNLMKALRIVEEVQAELGFDIAQTAQRFAQLSDDKEKPGSLAAADEDAIRIMTIHSAKGLEFPIVAVAECYHTYSGGDKLLLYKYHGTMHVSLMPENNNRKSTVDAKYAHMSPKDLKLDTVASLADYRSILLKHVEGEDLAERKRLLYVAMTRAEEALYISMRAKVDKDKLSLEPLHEPIAEALFGGEFPYEDRLVEYGGSEPLHYHYQRVAFGSSGTEESGVVEGSEPGIKGLETPAGSGTDTEEPRNPNQRLILEVKPESRLELYVPERKTGLVSYTRIAAMQDAMQDAGQDRATEDKGVASDNGTVALFESEEPTQGFLWGANGDGMNWHTQDEEAREVDIDKATDFGSAFHRIAQLGYLLTPERALERLEQVARSCGVADKERLRRAAEMWFSSEVYQRTLTFKTHAPEVPFCVPLDKEKGTYLEGAIDLLCTDSSHSDALVIDYKTGGSSAETSEELFEKHRFQAQCYAYALLNSGFDAVELVFARVEQLNETGELQTVEYSFTDSDSGLPFLS